MNSSWVYSLGGPLILIPQSACQYWNGIGRNYPEDKGDYGRACAVDDFIGLIDVGPARALVLGDDPARTTYLPDHGLLLREIAGDYDDDEVREAAVRLLPDVSWRSRLSWEITEPLVLFDSVYDYAHVIAAGEEQIHVDLAPGRYIVEAGYLEIPDTAYLILVRLTRDIRPSI